MNRPCDYNEDDASYLRLVRIGHAIWRVLKADRRLKSHTVKEERAFYDAIEIIVRLKQHRKAILRQERTVKSRKTREYFEKRATSSPQSAG
jgi:hypothetical protein